MADDVTVTDNPGESQYEARVGDALAGKAVYRSESAVIAFVHTEVDDAFAGQGVAGTLVRSALDDVAARGTQQVRAICPYVRGWIDKHPDYQYLLAEESEEDDG